MHALLTPPLSVGKLKNECPVQDGQGTRLPPDAISFIFLPNRAFLVPTVQATGFCFLLPATTRARDPGPAPRCSGHRWPPPPWRRNSPEHPHCDPGDGPHRHSTCRAGDSCKYRDMGGYCHSSFPFSFPPLDGSRPQRNSIFRIPYRQAFWKRFRHDFFISQWPRVLPHARGIHSADGPLSPVRLPENGGLS